MLRRSKRVQAHTERGAWFTHASSWPRTPLDRSRGMRTLDPARGTNDRDRYGRTSPLIASGPDPREECLHRRQPERGPQGDEVPLVRCRRRVDMELALAARGAEGLEVGAAE